MTNYFWYFIAESRLQMIVNSHLVILDPLNLLFWTGEGREAFQGLSKKGMDRLNKALLEEVHSEICPSLEYATDKSSSRPNKSKQTSEAPNWGRVQLL